MLEASVSSVYYDYYDQKAFFTVNLSNRGSAPVNITEVALQGPYGYYSTTGILASTPSLPLVLAPGESTSLNVTTAVALVQLDVYAQVQVEIKDNDSHVLVLNTTVVRSPGWMSGDWRSDLALLLPDLILHEAAGLPVPYNHFMAWGNVQTSYGLGYITIDVYNVTGNLLEMANTSWLINATVDLLTGGNVTNMTIDSIVVNESHLYISAHEMVDGAFHQVEIVEIEITYHPDLNMTSVRISLTEA